MPDKQLSLDQAEALAIKRLFHDNLDGSYSEKVFTGDGAAGGPTGGASGGATPYRNIDLGVTGQVVKATPGQMLSYFLFNAAATVRYFKFYDKATAPSQADTPKWTLPIPAGSGANVAFDAGVQFAAGIGVRATTGIADADVGAPAANDCIVDLSFA